MPITFVPGFRHVPPDLIINADEMGTRYIFQIAEHDMRDLLGAGEARWAEVMETRRDEILAACQRAYDQRPSSWHANVYLRLEARHFRGG